MQQYKNNPLAPPWMWASTYCPPAGSVDTYFVYVLRQVIAPNDNLADVPILFEGDGCFLWRMAMSTYQLGQAYIQLRDQLGRYTSNQPLMLGGWCGVASPLAVPELIPPGAQWTANIQETQGSGGGFSFYLFIGVKRRKV